MLTEKKKKKISRKIEECGSDGKKLFQLVNHLTGHKLELPLPTRRPDKELADEFANFFFSKIVKNKGKARSPPPISAIQICYT